MFRKLIYCIYLLSISGLLHSQQIRLLNGGGKISLRGLSVVSDGIIWVSGSAGSVGLSTDSGATWKWIHVKNYEKTDFRDIEAFNGQEAIIMGITQPAVLLRTTDGGEHWTTVFEDTAKSVFLDAMDFNGDSAMVVGDPTNSRMYTILSVDKGRNWKTITYPVTHKLADGEAFFAASGSNLKWAGHDILFVTGGRKSGLFLKQYYRPLLINQGQETTGANSIAADPENSNQVCIAGGDFSHDTSRYRNCVIVQLHPFIQKIPVTAPHGYRSCVEYLDGSHLICCGTTGVDYSVDGGINWSLISGESFHVCMKAKTGSTVYLAGPKSSIARLKL